MVDSDGNAPSLAGCKPTVRLLHYEPFEIGGPCGLCSRYLSLDRRVLWLIELTDLWKWMQGPELHRHSMLMRRAGALALPAI
jgi:hypothetical protein